MMDAKLYPLPETWTESAIGEVTAKAKQRDPRKVPDEEFQYVDVSNVSRESFKITGATPTLGSEAPSRARKTIREGDVLFATVRPTLQRIALVPPELDGQIASTGYCVLRCDKAKAEPRFLYSFLITDHFNARMARLERGANYPAVRDSDVMASWLPLPPLPEQKKIAHILSTVQRAIEAQDRIIQTTTELFKSMLHQLMTAQIRISNGARIEGDSMEYQGMVDGNSYSLPKAWSETFISEVTVKTKQRDPRKTPEDEFQYVDVSSVSRESLKITGAKPTLGSEAPSRARKAIETNDVLFATVRPTLKRIAVVPEDFDGQIASTAYCVLRSDNAKADPRFLYFFLITDHFDARMAGLERGANYPAVRDSNVKNSWFPLPPLPEQKKIAHILSTIQQKTDNAQSKKSKLQDLFRTLLHELMTAKMRINDIDTNSHMEAFV